jgi:D-glycero-D-manno-heptose 1,7-bisphosphate phosphatase
MIFRARRELDLNLAACVMVGDRTCDVQAGRAAGIRTVLLGRPERCDQGRTVAAADWEFESLLAFVRALAEDGLARS